MGVAHDLAEIGDSAHVPEQPQSRGGGGPCGDFGVLGQVPEGLLVTGFAGLDQSRRPGRLGEAPHERRQGREIEVRVAPIEELQGLEVVVFDPRHRVSVERSDVGRGAEGAVVHVAPGAARRLRQFRRRQLAPHPAIELLSAGEGDMVDVHVEAHADGVGGDQVIDLAFLVHGDLGVAGARAERAEDHRRAAALPAHQLGQAIDFRCREGDDGGARLQARRLALAGIAERRKPRPGVEFGLGHQLADQGLDDVGTQEHGLVAAPRAEQPFGEDVAAVGVGAHLDFVDADERRLAVQGHRFRRAQEIARARRDDLFLAGDQRH